MLIKPAKLLPIRFTLGSPGAVDAGGLVYRYTATLSMDNPFEHSDSSYGYIYTLANLNVGDYVATEGSGRIMKVVAIASQSSTTATVTVEDEFRLNQQQDSTGNSIPYIDSSAGVVFEVVEGKPILFPYSDKSTVIVGFVKDYATEIQSRFDYLRQAQLVSVSQAHAFVVGDIITYDTGTSLYRLLDTNDVFLGTVIEIGNPITNSFRYRPTGSIVDVALTGSNYFYWDPTDPGKLVNTAPASGNRNIPVFFKLSTNQAVYFGGADVTNNDGNFVTIGTAQTITGAKTFSSAVNVTNTTQATDINSGSLILDGGAGIAKNLYVGENLTIQGNFQVTGTTTIIETANLTVTDKLIELATGTTGAPSGDSGIVIERGSSDNIFVGWDESEDVFTVGSGTFTGATTGNLTLTDADVRFGTATFTTGKVIVDNTYNAAVDYTMYVLYATTSNATQTELFLNSSSTRISLPANTTMMFEADVVGRSSTGAKHCAFRLQGVIDRTSSSTAIIGTVNETIIAETEESWVATATADDTNDTVVIKVTGEVGTTIRWTAFVKTTSITH
jgi:hypothetical protein